MFKSILSFLILFLAFFSGNSQVYETIAPDYISSIQFSGNTDQSQLPIVTLGQNLELSFDALNADEGDFYYVITHHNFDWTESDLSKGEYLNGFDDIRIYEYENSFNSLLLYSHYRLKIPNRDTRRIKKSGNYLISIYDDDQELVFSRKFIAAENVVGVQVEIKRSRKIKNIDTDQVVQFVIDSPSLLLINPRERVKTLVMQNSNVKSAIRDLIPQYTLGTKLVYRYDEEATFKGGNEFYYFDNKEVRSANVGIRRIELTDIYENYLFTNGSRKNKIYTYNPDINGNFEVRKLYARDSDIEAEYVRMHFNLQYFDDLEGKELHIYGNFNNWTIDGSTYMEYDTYTDTYRNTRLFKQGFYNYKYVVVDRDGTIDEAAVSGSHWETENTYTVLVYYRELGGRYDRVIGKGIANSTNITNK